MNRIICNCILCSHQTRVIENKIIEKVNCCICDKEIEIEFTLPPTEDDKVGYACDECGDEINE